MRNKTIFICDDDRGITEMLEIVFQLSSMDVVVENNSVLAYEAIAQIKPDVLIVDLWMPVISGDLLIKKMKGNVNLKEIFVICMSASRNGEKIAIEAGADLFIAKPFDLDDILLAVDGALSAT
ncbi:response regulator [Sphingobacterium oryzagri]|uniref:Response regulator n=1 Tax=Sphingobacterium oryzagri TaxID=3025669 RepID=A0ABY7WC95_9SPHI|nr:response regulator [Sphingobacterium sp. KACC 22765]WDF67097.1 response regulator [Sphingobacterium sp. KACC 22765]